MSGHHLATVRRAGRKRGARFESSEALAEQPAVARSAVELVWQTRRVLSRHGVHALTHDTRGALRFVARLDACRAATWRVYCLERRLLLGPPWCRRHQPTGREQLLVLR